MRQKYHRAWIELLEPRLALSAPQFLPLPDSLTLLSGTTLNVALSGTDAGNQPGGIPAFYDFQVVGVSNVNLTNPHVQDPQLIAEVLDPLSNRSMKITVKDPQDQIDGSMTLQLFEHLVPNTTQRIIDLANGVGNAPDGPTGGGPFYDGLTFQRVIKDFMIQGGDPAGDGTGGSGLKLDDEIHAQLQFTSSGILAMANGGADTSDSQFFITNEPTRWLDFRYTILGFLTSGNDVLQKIESVPTGANDKPVHDVVMQTVEVFVDGENRTLRLFVPDGTTGTADVTVSISGDSHWDGTGDPPAPVLHTFHVTVAADTNNNLPFLGPIPTIVTTANTTKSNLQIPATDVEGDAITYDGVVTPTNANLTFTVDNATGAMTLQTANNWAGVASVMVGVTDASAQSWDTQAVPVYVNPAKPTVELLASADTGPSSTDRITNPNLTQDHTLGFRVSGLASGAEVVLYADGTEIGRATATSDSLIFHNPTSFTWSDGTHSITAKQTLHNQTVAVGNTNTTVELASDDSDPLSVSVDTGVPWITSTPVVTAQRGHEYAYHVQCSEDPKVQYQLTSAPGGMLVDLQTGEVTWTPSPTERSSVSVTVRVSDMAGNLADQSFQITMLTLNDPPVASPQQNVRVVSDTPKALLLTGDDGNVDAVQTLTYAIASQPSHGALSGFNPATGDVTYTPTAGYAGADSFTFTVTDDNTAGPPGPLTSGPATVSLQVVPVNHPPMANPQSGTTDEDTALTLTLTGDDGEPQFQQTLSFLVVDQPSHGTASILDANAGTVLYTPQPGYNGPDSFTFRTMDDDTAEPPFLTSDPATVSITVNPVEDPPAAHNGAVVILENGTWTDALPGDDGDPMPNEVQPIEFTITSGPSHGEVTSLDASTGAITYKPAQDFNGSDSITFTVKQSDTGVVSQPGTVTINVAAVNAPPVAASQQVTTAEDTTARIGLGSDGDPEVTQVLHLNVITPPGHGTLSDFNTATGEVTYVPAADFNGTDSFTFTLTDDDTAGLPNALTSNQATVTIGITAVDDPPRFLPPQKPSLVAPGQEVHVSVSTVDPDVPADPVRYSLEPGAPEGATIDPVSGQITFQVPVSSQLRTIRLTVRATEVTPAALNATQTIEVAVAVPSFFLSPNALAAPGTATAPSLITPPALSDLPTTPPPSPNPGFQLGFGPSDLLGSQSFFTDPFGPPPNGSGDVPVETPPAKPGQRTGDQKNASQQGTGDTSESDEKKDKAIRQGQTGVTSPELNDAALEEFMEGEDGLELAAADADLLLATAEW